MIREQYKMLRQVRLERCASYYQAEVQPGNKVTLDSPATDVMTDLKHVQVVTIGPDATLVSASKAMERNSVRSLLVADEKRCILGIVTSTDIFGEKPMQVVQDRGVLHDEVKVRDVMTPSDRLEVLDMKDVRAAEVGHVVATMQWAGRQHALVAEDDMSGRQMVRGIFSATQISKQLGVTISSTLIASTFAELEAVIAR